MTIITIDHQVVASAYDPKTRICSYTYEHPDGSRYTVQIAIDDLHKYGTSPASREQRRKHLVTRITSHVAAYKPDGHKHD